MNIQFFPNVHYELYRTTFGSLKNKKKTCKIKKKNVRLKNEISKKKENKDESQLSRLLSPIHFQENKGKV